MEFGPKKIRAIDLFDFTSFFNFSGPLWLIHMVNYTGHSRRTTTSPRRTRSRSVPPPLKGILKTNHSTTSQTAASTSWPLSSSPPCPPTTSCCCCKSITNEWDQAVMHPDDPERNYVSHCHTENRLWRPEAVVIHHRDSLNVAASKPQLQQMPHNRVSSHDPILDIFSF